MNLKTVERIVNTVLYEGYILYPYRASAVKNRQRFNFGALYPEAYVQAQSGADRSNMQTECLVRGAEQTTLDVKVRFLHLLAREIGVPVAAPTMAEERPAEPSPDQYQIVDSLEVNGQLLQTWQEAVERDVSVARLKLSTLLARPQRVTFAFPAKQEIEPLFEANGKLLGAVIRRQQRLEGAIEMQAEECLPNDGSAQCATGEVCDRQVEHFEHLYKVSVRVLNVTAHKDDGLPNREAVLMQSLLSAHTILSVQGGEFISLLDPPEALREVVASCENLGTWPVLVGEEGERDCLLSSPIILYDYPELAPESAGDLFDGTEIDEILTLRIMTLTDEEKRQMRGVDERARKILERTETLPLEQLMKMHGVVRRQK